MEKLLLYCTKGKTYLYRLLDGGWITCNKNYDVACSKIAFTFNGKIVGMCDCDNVEEIFNDKLYWKDFNGWTYDISTNTLCGSELFKKSCLKGNELMQYLGDKNGYALYLSNVEVFDKPKELSDYFIYSCPLGRKYYSGCTSPNHECPECYNGVVYPELTRLKKAPQNMCYCYDDKGKRYILLSIHPKYLCKIMNGEKTIEVRRKILNALKELIVSERT